MQVRFPDFDFSRESPNWGDNIEAVAIVNASAIIPPAIERYMIRVMHQARRRLDAERDGDLLADIDVFNRQEGQHLKLHASYLAMIRDNGYPEIARFEAAFAADLADFLDCESLAWNLSYCEGFEASGAAMSRAYVDGEIAEICGDRGSVPMALWRWHLAEEFEHRSVVHNVLQRLFGQEEAFKLRIAGTDFNRGHLGQHVTAAANYIHGVNRSAMNATDMEESVAAEERVWQAKAAAFGDRLNWVYDPAYDPLAIDPPREYEATLKMYAAG